MILRGFVGPTYTMDAISFDAQRTINQYPIISEIGTSKSVAAFASCPGYSEYAQLGGGPVRGAKTCANKRAFVVSGYQLYEIGVGSIGTLNTGVSRVSMEENGTQLMIVDGRNGYIFNMDTNVFAQISDADFPNGTEIVTFQDGYFICPVPDSANFQLSGIYDGLSWDPLDTSRADSNPDNINGMISDHGNLWLFGDNSVEVFYNSGALAFPFERVNGAVIQTGCAAPHTVQKFDNTLAWLGVDEQGRGVVWKAQDYNAVRMSTGAIEKRIASATDFSDSYAYVYHERGHVFYCLQVRGLDTTLVYDSSTGLWHERMHKDIVNNKYTQHLGACHFFFNQMNLIGDRLSGKIYRQSMDLYDFAGENIHRIRVSPHIQDEKRNVSYSNFELDMETGVGVGFDSPQIVLRYSDDGGHSWSNEKWCSVGRVGKYKNRARWSRLGSARDRVFEISYTEKTFYQLNEAYFNV